MKYIRNLVLTIFTFMGFFLYGFTGIVLYPYFWITGFRPKEVRYLFYLLARMVMFFVRLSAKKFTILSEAPMPEGAGIIVANHSSMLDLLSYSCFGVKDIVFIVKGWPFKIPIFKSYAYSMGNIKVEGADLDSTMAAVKKALDKGLKVGIFPEGTRSTDGKVHRFHSGAFRIAAAFNVPVIPFVIKGLGEVMPKNTFMLNAADVTLIRLAPIQNYKFTDDIDALKMAKYTKDLIIKKIEETL